MFVLICGACRETTAYRFQSRVLGPATEVVTARVVEKAQREFVQLPTEQRVVSTDTTYDSPRGASFGTSLVLHYDTGNIIDYHVCHKDDVGGDSWAIEEHSTRLLLQRGQQVYGPINEVVHDDCRPVRLCV